MDTAVGYHQDRIEMVIDKGRANPNTFELGDLVYARHYFNGGYHQSRIEMVINNGRHYFVSWVNPVDSSMVDMVVRRCHVMGYISCPTIRHERANPNLIGGQDEADRADGPGGL
eukprot:9510743-Ditylum_brightwellii.AAC.1